MVSITLMLTGLIGGFFAFALILWWVLWELTFRYKARIARQTGKDVSDVIWMKDRFKVIEKDGAHEIKFRHMLSQSQSIPGRFWTKTYKGKVKYTKSEWDRLDMSNKLKRGLMLYQDNEGEYKPMSIGQDLEGPIMRIVSQDNRRFMTNKARQNAKILLSKKQQMILFGSIILGIVILAVVFILFLVYITENAENICSVAANSITNQFLEGAQGAVGG